MIKYIPRREVSLTRDGNVMLVKVADNEPSENEKAPAAAEALDGYLTR